jgi:hypothetical protein
VRDLTGRIVQALAEVTLQADRAEAHALVERAERILAAEHSSPGTPPSLAEEFALRQRLLAGYDVARAQWPERCVTLATRIDRYAEALRAAGLDPRQLTPQRYSLGRVASYVGKAVLVGLVLLPAAVVGLVTHYPAYRAVGFVATGIAKGAEDTLASGKVLAAMLLFPLTWAAVAVALGRWRGAAWALAWLAIGPLTGYAALVFFERLDRLVGGARALGLFAFRRWAFLRLLAERQAIREEIVVLGREIAGAAGR